MWYLHLQPAQKELKKAHGPGPTSPGKKKNQEI